MANIDPQAVRDSFTKGPVRWSPSNYTKQGYGALFLRLVMCDIETLDQLTMKMMIQSRVYTTDAISDHDIDTSRRGMVLVSGL